MILGYLQHKGGQGWLDSHAAAELERRGYVTLGTEHPELGTHVELTPRGWEA